MSYLRMKIVLKLFQEEIQSAYSFLVFSETLHRDSVTFTHIRICNNRGHAYGCDCAFGITQLILNRPKRELNGFEKDEKHS